MRSLPGKEISVLHEILPQEREWGWMQRQQGRMSQTMAFLAVLGLALGLPLHAQQQPVIPTTQPPNPASPQQQQKKTPPVQPGSVLPSYIESQGKAATKVQPVPTAPNLNGWGG